MCRAEDAVGHLAVVAASVHGVEAAATLVLASVLDLRIETTRIRVAFREGAVHYSRCSTL